MFRISPLFSSLFIRHQFYREFVGQAYNEKKKTEKSIELLAKFNSKLLVNRSHELNCSAKCRANSQSLCLSSDSIVCRDYLYIHNTSVTPDP